MALGKDVLDHGVRARAVVRGLHEGGGVAELWVGRSERVRGLLAEPPGSPSGLAAGARGKTSIGTPLPRGTSGGPLPGRPTEVWCGHRLGQWGPVSRRKLVIKSPRGVLARWSCGCGPRRGSAHRLTTFGWAEEATKSSLGRGTPLRWREARWLRRIVVLFVAGVVRVFGRRGSSSRRRPSLRLEAEDATETSTCTLGFPPWKGLGASVWTLPRGHAALTHGRGAARRASWRGTSSVGWGFAPEEPG